MATDGVGGNSGRIGGNVCIASCCVLPGYRQRYHSRMHVWRRVRGGAMHGIERQWREGAAAPLPPASRTVMQHPSTKYLPNTLVPMHEAGMYRHAWQGT